mmetsp:Transcript_10136/g.46405  ORF Transcript_10136/g.46405 Transcript_10136/m.46405 type:complete len:246 (-) Transcript_10136:529-1266(-)
MATSFSNHKRKCASVRRAPHRGSRGEGRQLIILRQKRLDELLPRRLVRPGLERALGPLPRLLLGYHLFFPRLRLDAALRVGADPRLLGHRLPVRHVLLDRILEEYLGGASLGLVLHLLGALPELEVPAEAGDDLGDGLAVLRLWLWLLDARVGLEGASLELLELLLVPRLLQADLLFAPVLPDARHDPALLRVVNLKRPRLGVVVAPPEVGLEGALGVELLGGCGGGGGFGRGAQREGLADPRAH